MSNHKIQFLVANPRLNSGYACSGRLISSIWDDLGIDHIFQCTQDQIGYVSEYNRHKVYPVSNSRTDFGSNFVQEIHRREKTSQIISLTDVFVLKPESFQSLPFTPYIIADSTPLASHNFPIMKICKEMLAISKFGKRLIPNSTYIPLPIHPVYQYTDQDKCKETLEQIFGCRFEDDSKIINIVGANTGTEGQGRKDFETMLLAYKELVNHNPHTWLVLHTELVPCVANQFNIAEYMYTNKIPTQRILVSDQFRYITGQFEPNYLKIIYGASDYNLNMSHSGGLELTILESSACGCRPISIDAHCNTDHIQDLNGIGIKATPIRHWKSTDWFYADRDDLLNKLIEAVDPNTKESEDDRMIRSRATLEQYSMEAVKEAWKQYFNRQNKKKLPECNAPIIKKNEIDPKDIRGGQ